MAKSKFTGTGVALVTPFRKDESIDFKALEKLVEHVIAGGVDYLVVLGTTGESVTLSQDERFAVVDYVKEVNNKRVPMVVGMGSYITKDVIKSLNTYDMKGIDGVLSVTPYYNKPNQRGLYEHYKRIANETNAPIILYNVPGRTGANLAADTVLKLANEFKNVVAVKEASGNIAQIMQIVKNKPSDFLVISGDDAITFPLITLGVSGVISVVANAYPKKFSDMVNFALKGNNIEARKLHYQLLDFINALFEDGSPGGVKVALEAMELMQAYVRLPLAQVNKTLEKKIVSMVNEINSIKQNTL